MFKTGIIGMSAYMVLVIVAALGTACKGPKYENGMGQYEAKTESAKLTRSPIGECWGGEGAWQCLSRTGLWTACDKDGCQLILYVNSKDIEYYRK